MKKITILKGFTVILILFSLLTVGYIRIGPALSVNAENSIHAQAMTVTHTQAKTISDTTTSPCASSSPSSGKYSANVCFTSPATGAALTGDTSVTATVSVSGTSPGVQRMIFNLNGSYLVTDFQSPYIFTLPTSSWIDGSYTLSVQALMRDGFSTQPASISVQFSNGVTQAPVNNNTFQPTSGTTPTNGAPFVVAAGGDGAGGETNANAVINLLNNINPNLFLYLGDVYEKGSPVEFYNWYGTGGNNFSAFRSITDPTVGNHEYSSSKTAAGYFNFWDNIPNYYSFDAGGWHFISLNSNSSHIGVDSSSPQYQWLASDLAAHTQSCTIVYYHHPLYNIGPEGNTTSMAPIWALMAQYGVSIVINGHDHDYQRWVPLDANGNPSSSGITEFVVGSAGHGLQTFVTTDSRVAYSNDTNPTAFGLLKLVLNLNGASFSFINTSGAVLDSGVVPCLKAGADTQPPSVPGDFTAAAASATQVNMSWSASTDNVGVAGYTIYRNGSAIATTSSSSLTYSDTTAQPNTAYSYAVDAFDSAGNHSATASPISVTLPSLPSSLTFTVGADTYVSASSPTSNYGKATTFRLDASPDLHAYLRFTVQGLASATISRARLLVYANNSSSVGINAAAVADNSWGELTMNYNNAPTLGGLIASSGSFTAGNWVTLDVTSYVTGEGTYSFGITTTSSSAMSFPTKESGTNAAQLIVDLK